MLLMNETELLKLAVENLKETMDEMLAIAADSRHMNQDSRESINACERLKNRYVLCFTLKNAVAEIQRAVSAKSSA